MPRLLGLVVPLVLVLAPGAAAAGVPTGRLLVDRIAVHRSAGDSRPASLRMKALVDDRSAGADLKTEMLRGGAALRVAAVGLDWTLPFGSCRRVGAHAVFCAAPHRGVTALLRARPLAATYELLVRAPRAPVAGALPAGPWTVTLATGDGAGRAGEVRCEAGGGGRLTCGAPRPNLVVLLTDDQRWDTLPYMPNLQSLLVERGLTFTNAFVTSPVCAPSRAGLLTGQYAHDNGMRTNVLPGGSAPRFVGRDASTLATWLSARGYRTSLVGKYLNQYDEQCPPHTATCYRPPGWSDWHVLLDEQHYDYRLAENGRVIQYGDAPQDYSTDVLAAKAAEFIRTSAGQPYFVLLSFHAPHVEGVLWPLPAPRHWGAFADIAPWRPPSYDQADVSDEPSWVRALPRAATPIGPPENGFTVGRWGDLDRIGQLESLLAVDEAVAQISAAVEATGQEDDTVVVYTSDNGLSWLEHRWWRKSCPYEECLRVPLVIRYPRWIAGPRLESRLALNLDLAPTLAELAGTLPSSPVDGSSLVPLLRGIPTDWRTDFVIENWPAEAPTDFGPGRWIGVRTERWKYVGYAGDPLERELTDLESDPDELHNLADREADRATASRLRRRLRQLASPASGSH